MSYIDPTNQAVKAFIDMMTSLSEPDSVNPGTRALKTASVTNVAASVSIIQTTPGVTNGVVVNSGTLSAVTAITNALPAGTNIIGKVGIDQTTPGATNGVSVNLTGAFSPTVRTPGIVISSASSNLGTDSGKASVRSFSAYNQGSANATVLGQTIAPGVRVNFDAAGQGDTFTASAITYNGTGTTLVITYVS
jgi:hypothetical protein